MLPDEEKELNNEQEETVTPAEPTVESTEETPKAEAEPAVEAVAETPAVEEAVEEAAAETPVVAEEAEVAAVETVVEVEAETPVVVEEAAAEETTPETIEVVAEAVETEEAEEEEEPESKPEPKQAEVTAEETEEEEEEVELPVFDTLPAGGAHDDFNWQMDRRGALAYTPEEKATLLKQYDVTLSHVAENEIIRGRVSAISGGDVVLDINYKSDGLIAMSEFRDIPDLAQGDEVEVYVESQEDSQGQLGLSRRKAKILRAWESIVDSFKNGTIIRGTVISKTKGGLIVDCNGLETFLPGSQIDIKPVIDYDQYVGKMMEFKVVKVNEQIKNAVVSHKALIESDLAEQREQILGSLEKGQVLEGIVKNITDFGAFLDLGGVDGLLYITDISWGRIGHPSEVLQLNQRINVVVLDFDENKKRISLGLKQLTPHPWEVLSAEVNEGSVVTGKVVNIEDYGAFVEIQPGVEGLIHISEITWGNQSINAKEYFKMGQEVEARVVTIDRADRKMSLSIKQLTADPWSEIEERFPIGSNHTGTVKNITNYGIFVELSEGVGGMVHISDLSWTKRYAHPSEFTKVGSTMDVVVLDIDKDKRQISLGHKQTQDNPWDAFDAIFPIGSYHEATVLKRDDKGATFQMPQGLEAFAPAKHIKKEDGQSVDVGETVTVKVIEFNKDDRRILVSHTRYLEDLKYKAEEVVKAERAKESGEAQAAITEVQKKVEKETLGDLAALAQLKEQLDKE
ncbi:MAG: 30S ribosomal protein S1 [Lewinellaceae bacterium]|jgi:small subunit ribosomal protein S1|nr:30S ribosomal protein S1 [Lewinellaceae bacterium]